MPRKPKHANTVAMTAEAWDRSANGLGEFLEQVRATIKELRRWSDPAHDGLDEH